MSDQWENDSDGFYGIDLSEITEFQQDVVALPLPGQSAARVPVLLASSVVRSPVSDSSGDASRLVPSSRWDLDLVPTEPGLQPRRFGAFLENADLFDAELFGLSAPEAAAADPQQRLVLEACWESSADPRFPPPTAAAGHQRRVAVAVGISYAEYGARARPLGLSAHSAQSGTLSVAAGRISFSLALTGPAVCIDTACSSALVGVHLCAASFCQPGSEGPAPALAAGVFLALSADTVAALTRAGMLSPGGRCRVLDAEADGYARGESCAVHLLVPGGGEGATDGALVRLAGTAVNQDGRSSSLTAPHGPAQVAVMRSALEGGVAAANIAALELHGTGTALGDPIEIGSALGVLLGGESPKSLARGPLELMASKSRTLHSEPAAGAVGLADLAARLALSARSLHQPHLMQVNAYVSSVLSSHAKGLGTRVLEGRGGRTAPVPGQPWAVLRQPGPPVSAAMRAGAAGGVNAFAFQGTNAHAALTAAPSGADQGAGAPALGPLVPVSHWLPRIHHPLLFAATLRSPQLARFESRLGLPGLAFLQEHRVQDRGILPTALLLEAGAACGAACIPLQAPRCLSGVSFPAPLGLARDVRLESLLDAGTGSLRIGLAHGPAAANRWGLEARLGQSITQQAQRAPRLATREQTARKAALISGIPAQPQLRGAACAQLGTTSSQQHAGSWLHPSVGDASLQLAAALSAAKTGPLRLPGGAEAYLGAGLAARAGRALWVGAAQAGSVTALHHAVLDGFGWAPCASLYGSIFASAEEWAARLRAQAAKAAAEDAHLDSVEAQLRARSAAAEAEPVRARLGAADPRRVADVERALLQIATELLEVEVGADQPLMAAGLDSIGAVELRNAVGTAFGVELPATVAFDYPTVEALAAYVAGQQLESTDSVEDGVSITCIQAPVPSDASAAIVITAASTHAVAGDAGTSSFRTSLFGLFDAVRAVPLERWDADALILPEGVQHSTGHRFGVWIDGVAAFDHGLFRLSEAEAVGIDPQCRLLLEHSATVLRIDLARRHTAGASVYVGSVWTEYLVLQEALGMPATPAALTGSGLNFLAGRVSYVLGLQGEFWGWGPCMGLDTACSSSLVALHLARQALADGETVVALAAGTNLSLVPSTPVHLSQLSALSAAGRSQTFDAGADGYGRGEGVAVVGLEIDARDEGAPTGGPDSVLALVQGTCYNQDGRSSALTAPNGPAQTALIQKALRSGDARACELGVMSMHGTGTPLGDPIEISALGQAVGGAPSEAGGAVPLQLAVFKARLGHTEGAAGLHGALAAIACGLDGHVPSNPQTRSLNPYVASALSGWRVLGRAGAIPRQVQPAAPSGRERSLAGCSSFGMSGTNAFGLFESAGLAETGATDDSPLIRKMRRSVHWPVPVSHAVLSRLAGGQQRGRERIRLAGHLGRAALAFLMDHVIQETPILPGAAMLECVRAAAVLLLPRASQPVLSGAVIPAPLPLRAAGQSLADIRVLAMADAPQRASDGGWAVHPALADAALHLGPATGDIGEQEAVPRSRVVAGMEAFGLDGSEVAPEPQWITGRRLPMTPDGSVITDHTIRPIGLAVCQLRARPINLLPRAADPDRERLHYEAEWQVQEAAERLEDGGGTSQAVVLDARPHVQLELLTSQGTPSRVVLAIVREATLSAVQALQCALGNRSFNAVRSSTTALGPLYAPAGLASGPQGDGGEAVRALLRVLLQESPTASVHQAGADALARARPGTLPSGDAYGNRRASGALLVPRLLGRDAPTQTLRGAAPAFKGGATIITGGLGSLGMLCALWVSGELSADAELALLGRTGRASGDAPVPLRLLRSRSLVRLAKADVGSNADVAGLLQQTLDGRVQAIAHAGAVLDPKMLRSMTLGSVRNEHGGKVRGTHNLVRGACARQPLQSLQLFSSLAAFSAAASQGSYAAANARVESAAALAEAAGVPSVCVQWGNWGGGGMAARNPAFVAAMERLGLGLIAPSRGLEAMASLLGGGAGHASGAPRTRVVNVFLWKAMRAATDSTPFLSEFRGPKVEVAPGEASTAISRPRRGARASIRTRVPAAQHKAAPTPSTLPYEETQIVDLILTLLRELGVPSPEPESPFMESGLDSLGATQLQSGLTRALGSVSLTPTTTFDYPTPAALARHIHQQLQESAASPEATAGQADDRAPSVSVDEVLEVIAGVMGSRPDADEPLMSAGLDSLGAVQLRSALSSRFNGVELPVTLAMDYPTAAGISGHLASLLAERHAGEKGSGAFVPANTWPEQGGAVDSPAIEVVALAAAYPVPERTPGLPGQRLFWESAARADDLQGPVPLARWDIERYYTPDTQGEWVVSYSWCAFGFVLY